MKTLLLFLGCVISLPAFASGIITDTVVISPEDIVSGKAPLTCEVQRRKDGTVSLKLRVAESLGAKGDFEGYDLRVMKAPIAANEIAEKIHSTEMLAWHRPALPRTTLFVFTKEEIPVSYVVSSWSFGSDSSGRSRVKHICFSVGAIVDVTLTSPTKP